MMHKQITQVSNTTRGHAGNSRNHADLRPICEKAKTLITLKRKDLVSFKMYLLIPVRNKNHYDCKIVTE